VIEFFWNFAVILRWVKCGWPLHYFCCCR